MNFFQSSVDSITSTAGSRVLQKYGISNLQFKALMPRLLHKLLHNAPTREICRYYFTHWFLPPTVSSIYSECYDAIQECASQGDLNKAKAIHCLLLKHSLVDGFVQIWNNLLSTYLKLTGSHSARKLFDGMPERNVVSYNTLMSAYVRSRDVERAVSLYAEMKRGGIHPNHITLGSLIGVMNRGDVFHAHAIQCGLEWNEFVGSSLVERYAKEKRLADAMGAFHEILQHDLVSYNIMIDAYASNNKTGDALRVFSRMMNESAGFDGFTLTSIIKTCSKPTDLYCGMCLHGIALRSGLASETPLNNALTTMYSKCEKGMQSAKRIFMCIDAPNIVSWTAMISGLMQNKHDFEAYDVYKEMLLSGIGENHFVFTSILPIYGNLADYKKGKHIHARVVKSCFSKDVSVNNALIDMYSKCGSLSDAHFLFSTMEARDRVSYTTMITCLGQHGKGLEAYGMLKSMENVGLTPDDITFLACISACSHSGLLEEGIEAFRMMVQVYCIRPRKEHYSCIIDMMGRAGRLKEAEMLIEEMGVGEDFIVWETLLGACSIHGEGELGEKSAKMMTEIEAPKQGFYVLLANVCAQRGLWQDKGDVRDRLTGDGLHKEVGRSLAV